MLLVCYSLWNNLGLPDISHTVRQIFIRPASNVGNSSKRRSPGNEWVTCCLPEALLHGLALDGVLSAVCSYPLQ